MENGRIDYKVVLDTSAMQAEANQVTQSFQNMASAAQSEGEKIDNAFSTAAGNIGKAFAALGAAATFQQLTQKILQVRGEFQQLEVAFETMLGSAQQADTLMSQLVSTAATTPFGLQEVAGGAKQLLAYGTAAEEVNDTLVRLGDIAAGLSIPLGDLVYLYGTTQTQGRLYTQDLRQFMGRGIPLVEELAKQFGVAKEEVGELVTQGKVGFPEVKKAIISLTSEGSKFGGLMEKQSHTITGQISNIEDALDMMFNDLGKSSEGIINDVLSAVSFIVEHYEQFGKVLLGVVAAYGEYKAALMVTSAYQSMMAAQENSILATKEAALAQAIATANGETAATEANTMAKQANMSAIELQVQATMRALQTKQFEAQVDAQNAALELSHAQRRATASANLLTQRQAEYMAAVRSGDMSQVVAARTALETAATERQNAVLALNAAQEKATTTAKAAAAAEQKLSTFQTEVDTAAKTANATATGVLASVTNMATAAWRGLSAAMASNPIGMALMGITAVITAITMFSSSTDEATGAVDKLRQAATDQMSELQIHANILNNMPKSSKAYKDSLAAIVDLSEEHGITVEEENGALKDQEKVLKSLTNAIKMEAREKILAESASEANKKALESEKDAMDDLMDQAKNASRIISTNVDAYGNVTSATEDLADIQKITAAQWALVTQEIMSNAENIANAYMEGEEKGKEAAEKEVANIELLLASLGVSNESIADFHNNLVSYVNKSAEGFVTAYEEASRTQAAYAGLAGQTVDLGDAVQGVAKDYEYLKGTSSDTMADLVSKQYQVEDQIAYINSHPMSPDADASKIEYLRNLLLEIQGLMGDVMKGSLADIRKNKQAVKTRMESLAPDSKELEGLQKQYSALDKAEKELNDRLYGGSSSGKGGRRSGSTGGRGRSGRAGRGGRGGTRSTKTDPKDIAYNVSETQKDYDEALKEYIDKLNIDITHATIEAQEEGLAKSVQEIQQRMEDDLRDLRDDVKEWEEKYREKLKKQWMTQHPDKKEREYPEPAPMTVDQFLAANADYKKAYDKRVEQIRAEAKKEEEKARKEDAKINREALEDYLIEFGNYTAKRKALIAKANAEIADATTISDKMGITKRLQEDLAALDFEELKEKVNWEALFGDLDKVTSDTLKRLKKELQEGLLGKTLSASDSEAIIDMIENIDDELIDRQKTWRKSFGLVIPELEEQKRLIQEAALAQERLNDAQVDYTKAVESVTKARADIEKYITDSGKEFSGEISLENMQKIMDLFNGDKNSMNNLVGLFGNLSQAEGKLATTTSALGKAQEGAAMAASEAGGDIASTVAIIDTIVNKINDNVQSSTQLVEQLGLSDTKFGKGFGAFAESSQYAADAWNSLKDGNIMGVANGVVGSLRTLGDALGEWGIGMFGSSDKTLVKDLERLTRSNESLEGAVSRLTKTMEQQAGSDLAKTYKEAVDDLEVAMANTQEMIARSAAAYSNGFLGIGGKGSTNKKIAKLLSTADWQRISQIMGRTITDVSQIWEMSSEEMGKLLEHAPDIWAKFKEGASDGYKDISDYLDSYVELYDKLIDLQQQYNESITQTSFDNIKSGLADLINDTETNAYDVIGNVTSMLQNSILNIVLTKSMKPKLDKWYEDFANSMADDTLTAMEHAALEEGYTDIYKQAKAEVDRAYKLAGIDPNTGEVEDASTGAWSALGEETGRSLDGRMAAIHIQVTKIADMMLLDHEAIGRMDMRSMQDSTTLSEMHNLIFLSTEHLERVARNSDALPQINSKLEQIRQNTDRL